MARLLRSLLAMALGLSLGLALSACAGSESRSSDEKGPESPEPEVTFKHEPNVLHILVGGQHFADYVYFDKEITRPYFAHVKTPAGIQVTRNRPPDPDKDLTDHATMHPGIWMSFGDISGNDYWRLKAKVKHEMFVQAPEGGPGKGTFAVRNYYWDKEDTDRIAAEETSYTIIVEPDAHLLVWDSTFTPYGETEKLVFGDQEEFGLSIRVQTPLAEQFGGVMTDSEGRQGAEKIWSKQADWIDYSGVLDDKWIGMTIMPDPGNFRKSWYHARDYGFIAANPFGREAMKAGPKSEVVVNKGEELRLRYGVLIHSSDSKADMNLTEAYQRFLTAIRTE
ncbi:PmoA family protein [Acidobacteria bacterium AH-259-L09]|nr:PmoA family protein [Acidobacteria bacterium AH-259-L09]